MGLSIDCARFHSNQHAHSEVILKENKTDDVICLHFGVHVRGESKRFVDFVNKIKSIYAISLKLPYVCDQFNTNKHRKFQTNRLINIVSMAICLMRVSVTRSTPRR